MSLNRSKFNRDRVNSIIEVGVRDVLCYIFSCGTSNKSHAIPLDQYLENLPPDSTANFPEVSSKERKFTHGQKKQICRDPTCTTFDTTLLFKAIRLACEGVAKYNDSVWCTPSTMMEYYVYAIKEERNNSCHGARQITTQELQDTATRLRQLFHDALGAAKTRYKRSDAELDSKIQEVNNKLDEIMREVLGEKDLLTYQDSQLKEDLIKETNEMLKQHFIKSLNIDPMSFLTDTKLHLQVQKVFTEIKVTRGRVRGQGLSLKYQELVETARSGPSPAHPQVLLVEGIAGTGKTTFITLVTDEWLKDAKDRTITGLDYYDLLLRVQCRERKITSLNCLLKNEVSQVFLKFRDLVLPLIKKCKTLILIDGLDESNEDSEKLIDDILTQMKAVNGCTLLFTSRPEGITNFMSRIPAEYQVSYIELIGIPESHRELFVRRYHEEIKQQVGDTQDTERLVDKARQALKKEHFKLPLNMVFLTWVYIHDPSAITSTTTQTQLYLSTYELCVQKLLNRLAHYSTTRSSDPETLKTHLKQPLATVQYESLLALWRSRLTLQPEAVESIKDSCTDQGIPHKELLSGFLTLKASRTHLGIRVEQYAAPHKGLQDFYAALHIANHHRLKTHSASIRVVLEEALGKLDKGLSSLQNVLYHVAGLLHLLPSSVLKTLSEEVVDMLYESGMRNRDQWLSLVEDTRADPVVVRRVAPYFAADTTIYLGTSDDEDEEEEEGEEDEEEKEQEERETEKSKEEKWMEKGKDIEKGIKKTTEEKDSNANDSMPPVPKKLSPLRVRDARIETFITLLPFLPSYKVDITCEKDPGPRMVELLNVMSRHICMSMDLMHQYTDPDPSATSDQFLQQVSPRNTLKEFRGHLTEDGVRLLPRCIRRISLVLTDDDHAARTLTALHSVCHQLPFLQRISIHVPVAKVTPSSLIPMLPGYIDSFGRVNLLLSGVKDQLVEKACLVAKALQCHIRYNSIMFPRLSTSNAGRRKLLNGLVDAGVRLRFGVIMNRAKEKYIDDQLDSRVMQHLGCLLESDDFTMWMN